MKSKAIKITALLLVCILSFAMLPISASAASSDAIKISDVSVRYTDADGGTEGSKASGMRFTVTVNKKDSVYTNAVREKVTYDTSDENVKFGIVLLPSDKLTDGELTVSAADAEVVLFDKIYSQTEDTLTFTVTLFDMPTEDFERDICARAFVKVSRGGTDRYTYSDTAKKSFVLVGNYFYEDNRDNAELCARIDEIFTNCEEYRGKHLKSVTFTAFSDLHYWEGWYIASIADLETIMARANASNSDFVLQTGDFTNDGAGAPELYNAYLKNEYSLPVYGIYGNHELERGATMAQVTPNLTNSEVVWGTSDGKASSDGSIAYYYFDVNGIRMICLDANYSLSPENVWMHNPAGSYSYPSGNTKGYSLGPTQLAWLENVLNDAAAKDISCIVSSHMGFATDWKSSPDSEAVRAFYKAANEKNAGTVLMSISGHLHTNRQQTIDGVLHWDLNTVRNGVYTDNGTDHYTDQTFTFNRYSTAGKLTSSKETAVKNLGHSPRTWFFESPLSAVITVSTSGRIIVEGSETSWLGGVIPAGNGKNGVEPKITTGVFELPIYCNKKDD